MLIIMRKVGESIMLGSDIRVTILRRQGNQIRVGIEAPQDIKIYREEIFDAIQAQQEMIDERRS